MNQKSPSPGPFVEEREGESDPALAPAISDIDSIVAEGAMLQAMARTGLSGLTRIAIGIFGSLLMLILSVSAWNFVTSLLKANQALGWVALVLTALAILIVLILILREGIGFLRLSRLDHLRKRAADAHKAMDMKEANAVTDALVRLYHGRAEIRWGLDRFARAAPAIMDADARLILAESEILVPLDQRAQAEIQTAIRRVVTVTAVVPLAFADVLVVFYSNLAMIRRIAATYGGRAGLLGSVSLLRRIIASIIAAGIVALADDLVGSVAGGSILSKFSRRFGEGVVNGALTARIGVAAVDLCRPLPFLQGKRPGVSRLLRQALTDLIPTR